MATGKDSGSPGLRIRPMPNVKLRSGSKFILCNSDACHGETCRYAHSPAEMAEWNRQLSHEPDSKLFNVLPLILVTVIGGLSINLVTGLWPLFW